jgi:hypothetical protein
MKLNPTNKEISKFKELLGNLSDENIMKYLVDHQEEILRVTLGDISLLSTESNFWELDILLPMCKYKLRCESYAHPDTEPLFFAHVLNYDGDSLYNTVGTKEMIDSIVQIISNENGLFMEEILNIKMNSIRTSFLSDKVINFDDG